MVKCDHCNVEVESSPFKCKYCGGTFCVWHHLPEEHDCPNLHKALSLDMLERYALAARTPRGSTAGSLPRTSELRNIIIGVTAVALAAMPSHSLYGLTMGLLTALLAYLPHELAHKLVARKLGHTAHYVLSPWGLLLTFLSALPFMPVSIIVPGYVLVASWGLSAREEELISAAGPLTNIAIAALTLLLASTSLLARRLAYFSALVSVFNLIPIGPLDGRKIFEANVETWLCMFAVALVLLFAAAYLR